MPLLTQVQRALRAFDKLETLTDLQMVDEDAPAFDEAFHERIFVAEEVDTLLQEDGTGDASQYMNNSLLVWCMAQVVVMKNSLVDALQQSSAEKPMLMHYSLRLLDCIMIL